MPKTSSKTRRGNGAGSLVQDPRSKRWIARFHDAYGKRISRSTKTTNRRDAERMLAKWTGEIGLVHAGLVDPEDVRRRDERTRPLADHVREYYAHFTTKPRTKQSREGKAYVLARLLRMLRDQLGREPMLEDFTPTRVARAMRARVDAGRSARTANFIRQAALALAGWITAEGRANLSDFPARIPRFDESQDRRLVRRALTPDELSRLFAAADDRGRRLWYALAYYAGLRRGELGRVTWGDVDFEHGTIAIRNRKAGRVDVLPMHDELVGKIRDARPLLAPGALPTSRIFKTPVHGRTQLRDFARAGIPKRDDDGRVADLHALRTTLGTNLARAGVPVQVAARAMRHADPRTTQKHYTALGLVDVAGAIGRLSAVAETVVVEATGTCDGRPAGAQITPTSSTTSRRTKPRETARIVENASTAIGSSTHSQSPTPREDTGRFATRREGVLHSLFNRALSSAG
jgi:integrase